MNELPTNSVTARMNALAAAAFVTLILLAGVDTLAAVQGTAPQLAQTTVIASA